MLRFAVNVVLLVTFRLLTVMGIPVPEKTIDMLPAMNPVPVIVIGTTEPAVPEDGETEPMNGASVPTEKVTALLQVGLHTDNEYPPTPAVELMFRVAVNDVLLITLRLLTVIAELVFVPLT
jgi:hypothetical protein